jgi:hypothetical protein
VDVSGKERIEEESELHVEAILPRHVLDHDGVQRLTVNLERDDLYLNLKKEGEWKMYDATHENE